jgi:hypothetical protein
VAHPRGGRAAIGVFAGDAAGTSSRGIRCWCWCWRWCGGRAVAALAPPLVPVRHPADRSLARAGCWLMRRVLVVEVSVGRGRAAPALGSVPADKGAALWTRAPRLRFDGFSLRTTGGAQRDNMARPPARARDWIEQPTYYSKLFILTVWRVVRWNKVGYSI